MVNSHFRSGSKPGPAPEEDGTQYIATFFNHSGAIRFRRGCMGKGWKAALAPVPRALSSSCGTCVLFSVPEEENGQLPPRDLISEELEQVVRPDADGKAYVNLYRAKDI